MLVGLEGPVCSGKSSFAARMVAQFPGIRVFDDYVSGLRGEPIPHFDPGSTQGQLDAFKLFMTVEAERVAKNAAEPSRHTVLDRTVDTLFAHAYALDQIRGYGTLQQARETADATQYLIPDVTFWLQAPRQVLLDRAEQRGDGEVLAPFLEANFLAATSAYFDDRPVAGAVIHLTLEQYTDTIPTVVLQILGGA